MTGHALQLHLHLLLPLMMSSTLYYHACCGDRYHQRLQLRLLLRRLDLDLDLGTHDHHFHDDWHHRHCCISSAMIATSLY
jgi:hypothetical protein